MELYDGILTRRSVRSYDSSKPASRQQIEKAIEAACHAPSAHGKCPWSFVVVRNRAKLEEITKIHPFAKFVADAGCAVFICGDLEKQHKNGEAGYWMLDCSAAAQNILLAAHAMDLGTCWCGIYPVKERMDTFKKFLDLPEPLAPFCLVALGTPASARPKAEGRFDKNAIRWID